MIPKWKAASFSLNLFPYNGTTTTFEALWMGVPTITLKGDRHAGRVGTSILSNANLPELIAEDLDEYIEKAVALAANHEQIQLYRKNLRSILASSSLMDSKKFAKKMENIFQGMWHKWCEYSETKDKQHFSFLKNSLTPQQKMDTQTNNQAELLNTKGEALFNDGLLKEAEKLFKQALAIDPKNETALNNLGVLNFQNNNLEQAVIYFRQVLNLNPRNQAAVDNLNSISELLNATPFNNLEKETNHIPNPPEAAKEEIQTKIDSFPFWYHKIKLPYEIETPGWAPIDPNSYRIPADLTGKRVLDIGAWDGYWTFEALRRGAKEVIAIDDFSDFLGNLEKEDRKAWDTFDFCKETLGYDDERCKRFDMSVYDLSETTFGHFDIIFFFGTLYHLRYPLLALDKLAAICDEEIYIETAILDDFSPYKGGLGKGYPGNQMVMEFYPGKEYGNNDSNWWAPSLYCLINMVNAAGFTDCRGWKLAESPQQLPHCRGFAYGKKLSS